MRVLFAMLLILAASPAMAQDGYGRHHAGHYGGAEDASTSPSALAAPDDYAADALFDPAAMAQARSAMIRESGGMTYSRFMIDRAEYRVQEGRDAWQWEGGGWIGGDINRLAFRSKGEGEVGKTLDHAEAQLLYSRALDPWFNLEAGVRQDFGRLPDRTYAVLGLSGLAPYWFEFEGTAFLSDKGDAHLRIEGSYDQRLTQRLILQPALEMNFSAQDVPEQRLGSGLSDIELGLRLRYEIAREFAPYVGINRERRYGATARFARAAGEGVSITSLVAGVRFWF